MKSNFINLGKGHWKRQWIRKQDVINYLRCKYRFYLSFYEGIPMSELIDIIRLDPLFEKGISHESDVMTVSKPIILHEKESIESLSSSNKLIKITEIMRNHELGIMGITDFIEIEKGKFIPVEAKSHKTVTYFDNIELAFYWYLLEPLRIKHVKPKGYIELSTGRREEVFLTENILLDLKIYLDEIRYLKNDKPEPRLIGECNNSCLLYEKCREIVAKSGNLTIINQISIARENQFHKIGINNILDLIRADETDINNKLISKFSSTPGKKEIFRMKCHASSIRAGKPSFFGDEKYLTSILKSPYLIFDLEYDSDNSSKIIWLAGVLVVTKTKIIKKQFFSEKANKAEEKKVLASFINFLNKFPSHILITWSGKTADFPQLRSAWKRLRLDWSDLEKITANHLDLCEVLQNQFRFPFKSFTLDEMENNLNIKRKSNISGGREALELYRYYCRTKDDITKIQLKHDLKIYNLDDVNSTYSILQKIPEFIKDSVRLRA